MWHMFAIAAYSPTETERGKINSWLETKQWWQPIDKSYDHFYRWGVRPYVLLTSQWQRWNLFSPDPLRRVTNIYIERMNSDSWVEAVVFRGDTVPWYKQAKELKLLGRIDSSYREDVFKKRYMQDVCNQNLWSQETTLRWRKEFYVIPRSDELSNPQFWQNFSPDITSEVLLEFTCGEPTKV